MCKRNLQTKLWLVTNYLKLELLANQVSKKQKDSSVNFNTKVANAIIESNNNITIKEPKPKYPEGSVGFDTTKANYVGHLIKDTMNIKSMK